MGVLLREKRYLFVSYSNIAIIGVRGKACAPQLMLLSIGLPDEKQLMGAYSKVPNQRSTKSRDERPQTGAQAPGSSATIKEAPTGRQRPNHVIIKHVTCSVALSGLSFVNALVPGVFTPGCVLSRLRCLFSGQQYNAIKLHPYGRLL